jgi:hypothetical protein
MVLELIRIDPLKVVQVDRPVASAGALMVAVDWVHWAIHDIEVSFLRRMDLLVQDHLPATEPTTAAATGTRYLTNMICGTAG